MKRSLFACLFLVTVGCGGGGDDASPEDRLQGQWGVDQDICVTSIAFQGNQIEVDAICELPDGTVGQQASVGTFVVNGNGYVASYTKSSCPPKSPADRTESATFDFVGDKLRIVVSTATLVLEPITKKQAAAGGGAIAQFGCFDQTTGEFTPRAVQAL